MCVMAICENGKKLTEEIFNECFDSNDHGAGFAWRDGEMVGYCKGFMHKNIAYKNYKLISHFPHVAHFRLTSAGETCQELTHPFLVTKNSPISMSGISKIPALFHNGTVSDWKKLAMTIAIVNKKYPDGEMSDTRVMAMMVSLIGDRVLELDGGKYAIVTIDRIDRYGDWTEKDGIYYSNMYFKQKPVYYRNSMMDDMWGIENGLIVHKKDSVMEEDNIIPLQLRGQQTGLGKTIYKYYKGVCNGK